MPFGQPLDPSQYSKGFIDLPQGPMAQAVAPKPKINWLGVLADALSGAAGQTPLYTQGLLQQRQQQQEEQTYQHRKADSFDLWRQQQEYAAAHQPPPQPTSYGRELIESGLQPGTPEYTKRMSDHLNAMDDPIVTVPLPGNRIYSGPRSGLAAALSGGSAALPPAMPVGPLTPIGGSSSGSGNFR